MTGRRLHPAAIGLIILLFALALRAQTFGNPLLHIDEGFYLLVGDRIGHGAVPFVDIWDRKPVGLFLIYAAMRGLGSDGILQYQLVATLFVAMTGFGIARLALRVASPFAALFAGLAYVCWVTLFDGDGGQTPIFYNALMIAAASLAMRVATGRARTGVGEGALAMLLVGCAIQIKYNVVFEGIYFGMGMLWARRDKPLLPLAGAASLWIMLALLPTLGAYAAYIWTGHGPEFAYANFISIFERVPQPLIGQIKRLCITIGIFLPLFGLVYKAVSQRQRSLEEAFLLGWLAAAMLFYLLFGTYFAHYALPLLLPILVLAAVGLDQVRRPKAVAFTFLAVGAIASSVVSATNIRSKGDMATARRIVAEFDRNNPACPYIFDGNPVLYFLSGTCLPSKYIFPGHLNSAAEAQAIGVDQRSEISRIMAHRPQLVMTLEPHYAGESGQNRAVLDGELAAHYRLDKRLPYGRRTALIYRPR